MCEKHYRRWWRETNKEHNKAYEKKHYEEVLKLQRTWKPKSLICKSCNSQFEQHTKGQIYCSFKCRNRYKYLTHKVQILQEKSRYYTKNKKSINKQKTEYKRAKRAKDPIYKLKDNLRSRLNKAIAGNYKSGSAIKDLGCSIAKLKIYLQLQFYRNPINNDFMIWDNYGKWEIDHVKPLSSFDLSDLEQLRKACHYTNLQPMWAKDNKKKSNKITDKVTINAIQKV